MARDEHRRTALAADLARRLAPISLDGLRLIDRLTLAVALHEQHEGPIDLQALRRTIVQFDPRTPIDGAITAALVVVAMELAIEDEDRAELHEQARAEMLDQPGALEAVRQRRGVDEIQIGRPGDNWGGDPIVVDDPDAAGFAAHEQQTRLGPESARIALDEDDEPYDELAVEWGLDPRDEHAGEGR